MFYERRKDPRPVLRLKDQRFKSVAERDLLAGAKSGRFADPEVHGIRRGITKYLEDLPTFKGGTVIDYLEADAQNPQAQGIRLLDLGCGTGTFLAEVAARFPKVKAYGISATDLRPYVVPHLSESLANVDYKVADMHSVRYEYEDGSFDYIVSDWALRYTADPLSVVKQVYRLLKDGGIAFLQQPQIRGELYYKEMLEEYWSRVGVEAELHGGFSRDFASMTGAIVEDSFDLSFKRGSARKLSVPFSYEVYNNGIGYRLSFREIDKAYYASSSGEGV